MTHCCAPTYTEFSFDNQYLTLTDANGNKAIVDLVGALVSDLKALTGIVGTQITQANGKRIKVSDHSSITRAQIEGYTIDANLDAQGVSRYTIYTYNTNQAGPSTLETRLRNGDISPEQIEPGSYLIESAQNMGGRIEMQESHAYIASVGVQIRRLVVARWDLFWHTAYGGTIPLQDLNETFEGPYWAFMADGWGGNPLSSGTSIPDPLASYAAPAAGGEDLADVYTLMETVGWTITNKLTAPWGYGMPYEPRMNFDTKVMYFNQQKMDFTNEAWQESISDYLAAYVSDIVDVGGIFFQFTKPQHYGNKVQTYPADNSQSNLVGWLFSGSWDPATNTPDIMGSRQFITYDEEATNSYDWFLGLQGIFNKLKTKTDTNIITDFRYYGIEAWQYAAQVAQQYSADTGASLQEAVDWFYLSLLDIGRRSYKVAGNFRAPAANSDPIYQPPEWFYTEMEAFPQADLEDLLTLQEEKEAGIDID